MRTIMVSALVTSVVIGLLFVPLAHSGTSWYDDSRAIDWRQTNQDWNIRQGVYSGSISAAEAERLYREQARIRDMEAHMKSDGILTYQERVSLNRELNQTATHIYRERYDDWLQRWPGGAWYDAPAYGPRNGSYGNGWPEGRYDKRDVGWNDKWREGRNEGRSGGWQQRPVDRRPEPRQGRGFMK